MNNSNQAKGRRNFLKTLLVGGGVTVGAGVLPEKWVKPVVKAVILPVHAQTSMQVQVFQLDQTVGNLKHPQNKTRHAANTLLDMIIPPAKANDACYVPTNSLVLEVPVNDGPVKVCFSYPEREYQTQLSTYSQGNMIGPFSVTGSGPDDCIGQWAWTRLERAGNSVTGYVHHQPAGSNVACEIKFSANLVSSPFTCKPSPSNCPA